MHGRNNEQTCGYNLPVAQIVLRDYQPADFESLYRIDQACYPRGMAYTRRMLRWFLGQRDRICVVAEAATEIAGFILADCDPPEGHIVTIDVLEPWRRHGIGSRLVAEAERRLKAASVSWVELETATTNEAAVAFWHKHGYRTGCVLRGYYPGRQDAYWMHKSLTAKSSI